MSSSIHLNNAHFAIDSGTQIIKPEQYKDYLDARTLLEQVEAHKDQMRIETEQQREQEKIQGYKDGKALAQCEHIEHMIETVSKTIHYIQNIEEKICHLVVDATRQIIGQFDDIELALAVVKKALHLVSKEKQIILHVAPEYIEQLQARVHEVLVDYPGINFIEVLPDPRLEKGGCLLESPMGLIDASVEVQLNALQSALLKNFRAD